MNDQISKHFSRWEFACRCGCGQDTVDVELISICETVRELVDAPITPSSGNRCETHNAAIGGGEKSQHLLARAADLSVEDPSFVYQCLCDVYPDRYGFGVYDSFVHVDSRAKKARWDKRST